MLSLDFGDGRGKYNKIRTMGGLSQHAIAYLPVTTMNETGKNKIYVLEITGSIHIFAIKIM